MWRGAVGCTRRACAAPQSTSTRGCWRILTACGKGSCGRHVPHVLPHSPPPHARVDSECKRWNLERVVLDLFSHFTLGKVQVRWLCVSCRGSRTRPTHIALHEHHVMQFPFLPERRGRGAPMAPVPLKCKRDTSNEPKTDPMKRAYMLVPDEAKLWFVEFHAYQARVHGKSLACKHSPGEASGAGALRAPNLTHAVAARLSLSVPTWQHVHRRVLRELGIEFEPSRHRTQIVYEKKTDRVRLHGPIFPRQHHAGRFLGHDRRD